MSTEGSEYESRFWNERELLERGRRAEILQQNKRDIAANVLQAELDTGEAPVGIDSRLFKAVVEKLIAKLRAA